MDSDKKLNMGVMIGEIHSAVSVLGKDFDENGKKFTVTSETIDYAIKHPLQGSLPYNKQEGIQLAQLGVMCAVAEHAPEFAQSIYDGAKSVDIVPSGLRGVKPSIVFRNLPKP